MMKKVEAGLTRTGRKSKYGAIPIRSSSDDSKLALELTNGGSEKDKSGDEIEDVKPKLSEDMVSAVESIDSVMDDTSVDEKQASSPSDSAEFHGFDSPSNPNTVQFLKKLCIKYEADLEVDESSWTEQDAEEFEPLPPTKRGQDNYNDNEDSQTKLRGQDIYTDSEDENTKPAKEIKQVHVASKKRPLAQLTEEFNEDEKHDLTQATKRVRKKSVKAREAAEDAAIKKEDLPSEVSSSADVTQKGKGHKGESHRDISSSAAQGSRLKHTARPDDKNSPLYLKPFELGWKRELVYRSTEPKGDKKTTGDIYYYTPGGKKVRSRPEIEQYLIGTGLTMENFTFQRESLGLNDESKEVIRHAKKSGDTSFGRKKEKVTKVLKSKIGSKISSAVESSGATDKVSSSPSVGTTDISSPVASTSTSFTKGAGTPRVMLKQTKQSPKTASKAKGTSPRKGNAESPTRSKGNRVKKENQSDGELEVGTLPTNLDQSDLPQVDHSPANSAAAWKMKTTMLTSTSLQSCSVSCAKAQGVPSLQCSRCLCLYHPECVGIKQSSDIIHSYVCKNCHTGSKEIVSNTLSSSNSGGALSYVVQKSASGLPRAPVSPLRPRTGNQQPLLAQSSMSSASTLVGGLTTWLPSSSSVQVQPVPRPPAPPISGPSSSETPVLPQTVANIGGQKFIVVPKHNVLSVSPAVSGHSVSAHPASNFHHPSPSGLYLVPYSAPGSESNPLSMYMNGASYSSDINCSPSELSESKRGRPAEVPESTVESSSPASSKLRGHRNMGNFISDLSFGYVALFHVMGYLKVQELLRASRVCRMWRDLSLHPDLWRTVRMKNSQVSDWDGFAAALRARGTRVLDLRKILAPGRPEDIDHMWSEFCRVIGQADSLQHIELSRCPASVVEQLARSCSQLRVLNAIAIKSEEVDLESLQYLPLLEELRLKSTNGMNITKTLDPLVSCRLRHLSLTSIKNLGSCNVNILSEIPNLESLELGDCMKLSNSFGPDHLVKLQNLKRLRLEKGEMPGCPIISIIEAVSKLPALEQLEIINFDVKPGFDKALAQCKQLRRLLIIPTYIITSASTNHIVLCSIPLLADSLEYLVWGLTQELTRVTDLFIDQCEQRKGSQGASSKLNAFPGECIPIIKPVVKSIKEKIDSPESGDLMQKDEIKMEVDDNRDSEEMKEANAVGKEEEGKEDKGEEEESTSEEKSKEKEENSYTDDVESLARGFRALSALQQQQNVDNTNPGSPPVSILPIPKLHKLLTQLLPNTHVKILKVPFPSTWRQTFPELNSF